MAITNPTKYVSVQRLGRFENKLQAKYVPKDTDATSGNLAAFDGNGNPVDSGKTLVYADDSTCESIVDEL